MKKIIFLYLILFSFSLFSACSNGENHEPPIDDSFIFAKGADVSWLTEMEYEGMKFYNSKGQESECMSLLRELGMNSIRLRVWVDPVDGWCNKNDLLVKATRANNLGMRLMIDFHYSDSWADPGKQTKPAAWADLSFEDLMVATENHTKDVLSALKAVNIFPEWVQLGNETGNGMLWEDGKASVNMTDYAKLNNAAYYAVKEIFPDAKTIVHLQEGDKNDLFRWLFDGLKENGGKWDVIGMSLYPPVKSWRQANEKLAFNIRDMINRYGCDVMICEVGMSWDEENACYDFLSDLIEKAKSVESGQCLGVFYWEPQAYNGWKGYTLGAFNNDGSPTKALDAFKERKER